jgi:hypothetical protein
MREKPTNAAFRNFAKAPNKLHYAFAVCDYETLNQRLFSTAALAG